MRVFLSFFKLCPLAYRTEIQDKLDLETSFQVVLFAGYSYVNILGRSQGLCCNL